MTVIEYLNGLRPGLPMSAEKPLIAMTNGELRRQLAQGAIVINGERATHDERMDFPVFSLVFFPKSDKRRTTLV